jgi:hypothetical protein
LAHHAVIPVGTKGFDEFALPAWLEPSAVLHDDVTGRAQR